jgi:protoheme IX farnesyltransferase
MSSTLSRLEGAARAFARSGWRATFDDYLELTKPRIIVLLLITTLAAMIMAARGIPPLALTFWTLLGGALSAASAGAFNCVYDADIDSMMRRTMARPVPRGAITPNRALAFAMVLGIGSFLLLNYLVNPLAAWLSLGGNAYYVFVYTMWLKRSTSQNIVIGGFAGSIPPLVGWAAVTGTLGAPALALAVLIFLWTPPHFWALALNRADDYAKAGVPMLPVVSGSAATKRQILIYSAVLVPTSVLPWAMGFAGAVYGAAAAVCGAVLVGLAFGLGRSNEADRSAARRLFVFSIIYLFVLFAALLVDHRGSPWWSMPASQRAGAAAALVDTDVLSATVQPDRHLIGVRASEV